MAHHGILDQHGIQAMCDPSYTGTGRFGRIFPKNPTPIDSAKLQTLGQAGGVMDAGTSIADTIKTVPAGMVFLGQFIDHDITLDVTSQLDQQQDPNATQNFRTPVLDLDCIYGNGPEASPHLFHRRHPDDPTLGAYLVTGADGSPYRFQLPQFAEADLPRNGAGTAVIGDPRNDENRIISQMQLAFIRFHNEVVDRLKANGTDASHLYEEANNLVRWHYQWIVINEFLPAMIGNSALKEILTSGRKLYTPLKPFIPIEFAAAAYRFGHSMVPETVFTVNDVNKFNLFNGNLGIGFCPVAGPHEIIDWSFFFDYGNGNVQFAQPMDSKLSSNLLALPFIPSPNEKSLATRNLLRGNTFLLPRGNDVAKEVADKLGVTEADLRVQEVVDAIVATTDLDANEIPLWFYILKEAEIVGKNQDNAFMPGEGLGPVGGRIVGEVLLGLMELNPRSYLNDSAASNGMPWAPTLGPNTGEFTMRDLLTLADNQKGISRTRELVCKIPFA